jgi:hypothetical protein
VSKAFEKSNIATSILVSFVVFLQEVIYCC